MGLIYTRRSPRTNTKPRPWPINPRRVAPEWRWAWKDLELLLPLWPGEGTSLSDISLHQRHADLIDGDTVYVPTRFGIGLDVDVDVWKTTGYTGVLGTQPRTCFVFFRAEDNTDKHRLFSWGNDAAGGNAWRLAVDGTDGNLRTEVHSGFKKTAGDYSDGEWHRVVQRWSGSNVTDTEHFADGVGPLSQTDSASQTPDTADGEDLTIAVSEDDTTAVGANDWAGEGALLAIWSRALGDSQVWQLMDDPFGLIRPTSITLVAVPADVGGQTVSESVSDSVLADDTTDDVLIAAEARSDGVLVDDTETNTLTAVESPSDGVLAGDTESDRLTAIEARTDSVLVDDTAADVLTAIEAPSDIADVQDVATNVLTAVEVPSDAVLVEDTVTESTGGQVIEESVSDGVLANDTTSNNITATESVSDETTAEDTASPAATAQPSASDGAKVADTGQPAATASPATSDGVQAQDITTNRLTAVESVSDGVTVEDAPSDLLTAVEAALDQVLVDDSVNEQLVGQLSVLRRNIHTALVLDRYHTAGKAKRDHTAAELERDHTSDPSES